MLKISPRHLRRTIVAACGLLVATVVPAHVCPPDELLQAELGNQPAAFVESGPNEFFTGGLAGSVRLDASGVFIAANGNGRQGHAADLRLDVVGATWNWQADPDSRVIGDVTRVSEAGLVTTVPGYRRVRTAEVVPGVLASAQSSNRRFELILQAEDPARLEAVRLELPTALDARLADSRLQVVEAALGGGAAGRRLDVDLVVLESTASGLRAVESTLASSPGGTFSPQILGAFSGPVEVRVSVLFGPYQEPSDRVRTAGGELLTVHSTRAGGGSARRFAVLSALTGDGLSTTGRLWVDTGADLDVRALAVSPGGGILLAGERRDGESGQAFLAELDMEQRRFDFSPATAQLGAGSIRGLHSGADGRILLVAVADETFEPVEPQAADYSLALPRTDMGEPRRLVVAELSAELDRFVFAHGRDVLLGPWRLDVWVDCHGTVRAGVHRRRGSHGDSSHSYTFGVPSSAMQSQCPLLGDGWGYILMCSKWLMSGGGGTYDPAAAPASSVPTLTVERPDPGSGVPPDYEILNELEDNLHGPIFNPLPGGLWTAWENYFYSSTHAALTFVYYNQWWNSAMAMNARVAAGTAPPTFRGIVVREATFCADSDDDLPHNLCDFLGGGNGWPYLEVDVAAACQTTGAGAFELEEMIYDVAHQGTYYPDQVLLQDEVMTWFPSVDGTPGVGDPPEQTGGGDPAAPSAAHFAEIGARLDSRAWITLELFETEVQAGAVSRSDHYEAHIASRDTH